MAVPGQRAGVARCRGRFPLLLLGLTAFLLAFGYSLKLSPLIEKISDHKDFKKLLRTRNNILVLYSKSENEEAILKLRAQLQDAVVPMQDIGEQEEKPIAELIFFVLFGCIVILLLLRFLSSWTSGTSLSLLLFYLGVASSLSCLWQRF